MTEEIKKALVVGEMAEQLGVNVARIRYIIVSKGLKAETETGSAFIYSEDDFATIKAVIDSERSEA